ncbi:MAG: PadR family transcriptional regulator [archaeon]
MDWKIDDAGIRNHMCKGMLKLFILFSLVKKEMHGYALLKEFNSKAYRFLGGWKLGVGEFYAVLSALEEGKILKSSWTSGKRPKKIFSLTAKGKTVVKTAKGRFSSAMMFFREVVPELFNGSAVKSR